MGLSNLLRFTWRGKEKKGKMLKREKTETSNQQTKAAHTVGVCPSSRARTLLPKPKGIVCIHAHPNSQSVDCSMPKGPARSRFNLEVIHWERFTGSIAIFRSCFNPFGEDEASAKATLTRVGGVSPAFFAVWKVKANTLLIRTSQLWDRMDGIQVTHV